MPQRKEKMLTDFVELADTYKDHYIGGHLVSRKLNGMRAFWDGGVTVGQLATNVPWANTERDTKDFISTGLWSRLGKVVNAPRWWIEQLPKGIALDGELWLSSDNWNELVSITKRHDPDSRWEQVLYKIYGLPGIEFYLPRTIRYDAKTRKTVGSMLDYRPRGGEFRESDVCQMHQQLLLPSTDYEAKQTLSKFVEEGEVQSWEGVILRRSQDIWIPKRHKGLLKWKPYIDSEAKVLEILPGEGKHLGRMGSLKVLWGDKIFNVSGFTDAEREDTSWVGKTITFRYVRLTPNGIPIEARYHRKYYGV